MEKCEIAHFEHYHLFQQYFPTAFLFDVLKQVHMEKRVDSIMKAPQKC